MIKNLAIFLSFFTTKTFKTFKTFVYPPLNPATARFTPVFRLFQLTSFILRAKKSLPIIQDIFSSRDTAKLQHKKAAERNTFFHDLRHSPDAFSAPKNGLLCRFPKPAEDEAVPLARQLSTPPVEKNFPFQKEHLFNIWYFSLFLHAFCTLRHTENIFKSFEYQIIK